MTVCRLPDESVDVRSWPKSCRHRFLSIHADCGSHEIELFQQRSRQLTMVCFLSCPGTRRGWKVELAGDARSFPDDFGCNQSSLGFCPAPLAPLLVDRHTILSGLAHHVFEILVSLMPLGRIITSDL